MSPSHLPLHEQLTHTDGSCETFAVALLQKYGAALSCVQLVVCDERYAEAMDYPGDARIEAHVFCMDVEGWAIDAEGRRPVPELLRSFGVNWDYDHEIEAKQPQPAPDTEIWQPVAHAAALIDEHDWPEDPRGIPRADGALSRNFRQARKNQQDAMAQRLLDLLNASTASSDADDPEP